MYALLVAAVLALTASPVFCTYYGEGVVYITQSEKYDKSAGVRFVFRPEQPELYARAHYKSYLGFITNGDYDMIYAADNLTRSKYDGWTLMRWEPYGLYYYADNLKGAIYLPLTPVAHAVDIFNGDELIYQDGIHRSYYIQYSTYCVLDGEQRYDSEYKCSEALDDVPVRTTSSGDDTITTGSNNSGAVITGLLVTTVVLLLVIVLVVCTRINRRAVGHNRPTSTHSVEEDRVLDQPSNRTNDLMDSPPCYTMALNSSLPEDSTIESGPQVPRNSLEQLPTYASAVKSLSTQQLHDICPSDCSSNVQNEMPQQNNTASHSDGEHQV